MEESYTDGIGIRSVIFTQGCAHKCTECHNPETHSFNGGFELDEDEFIGYLMENKILDGVTFSGGDPMYQAAGCTELAKKIKDNTNLNIWCYTGFTYGELIEDKDKREFLNYIDILVDGMYEKENRSLHLKFRGSSNQRLIDVKETLKQNKIITIDID